MAKKEKYKKLENEQITRPLKIYIIISPRKTGKKLRLMNEIIFFCYILVDGITMAHVHKTSRYIQLQQCILIK
jgi:hypothetical protein